MNEEEFREELIKTLNKDPELKRIDSPFNNNQFIRFIENKGQREELRKNKITHEIGLSTFSKKGNSYEAEPGNSDDLAMCLVLFAWLTDQSYFKEYTDINTLMSLREKTEEDLEQDMSPFGFVEDGRPEEMDIETMERYRAISPDSWMWQLKDDF